MAKRIFSGHVSMSLLRRMATTPLLRSKGSLSMENVCAHAYASAQMIACMRCPHGLHPDIAGGAAAAPHRDMGVEAEVLTRALAAREGSRSG